MEDYRSSEEREADKLREELNEMLPILVAKLEEMMRLGIEEAESWVNENTGDDNVNWLKRELLEALLKHLIEDRAQELREAYGPYSRVRGRSIEIGEPRSTTLDQEL